MQSKSLYIMVDTDNGAVTFPVGETPIAIKEYTYTSQRMGSAPQITASFDYERVLGEEEWRDRPYVILNDERFEILNTPTSKKAHDNLKYEHEATFVNERIVLEREFFYDVVTTNTEDLYKDRVRSNVTDFSFMGTIEEFVSRLNDALVYVGFCDVSTASDGSKIYDGYHIVIDDDVDTSEIVEVAFENQYLSAAIQEIFNSYDLSYYWVGKTCHVGDIQNEVGHVFEYGSKTGLLDITDTNSGDAIVDRITGYGSSDNIPYYYPNDNADGNAIFTTENFDKSLVGYINIEILRKSVSNPYDCTLTLCDGMSVDEEIYLREASIGDATYKSINDSQPADVEDRDNQSRIYDSFVIRYKVKGRKGSSLDLSNFTFKETHSQYVGMLMTTKKFYYKAWDGSLTWADAKELPENNYIDFGDNNWYMVICEQSFDYAIDPGHQGQITVSVDNDKVLYKTGASEGLFLIDTEGHEISLSSQVVEFTNVDSVPRGVTTGVFEDGQWKFTTVGTENAGRIIITGREWIQPSQYLMPSIYRSSRGADRYYNAINKTYLAPTATENPTDEDGYYIFENLYKKGFPHSAIQEFEDIKPTIRDMRNAELTEVDEDGNVVGQLFGEIADIAFDENDSDETTQSGSNSSTTLTYVHSYFYIKLHLYNGDYGFNLFDQALEGESAVVSMITGNCAACEFEIGVVKKTTSDGLAYYFENPVQVTEEGDIVEGDCTAAGEIVEGEYGAKVNCNNIQARQQDTTKYEVWIALKKEVNTYNQVMPNRTHNYLPQKGDLFVLTGIKMPKAYVLAAEKRLEDALIEYMSENNTEKFNFSVVFSRIWLERNPSIVEQMNENSQIKIKYNDKTLPLYVTSYSIKADGNVLNEISVELAEELNVQQSSLDLKLQDVKDEILAKLSKTSSVSSIRTTTQLGNYISKAKDDSTPYSLGAKTIKTTDDITVGGDANISGSTTTEAVITNSVKTPNYSDGMTDGAGGAMWVESSGKSHIQIDFIEVRQKATFNELEVNKIRYAGGDTIFSRAGNNIVAVAPLYSDGTTDPQPLRLILDNTGAFIADADSLLNFTDGETKLEQVGWRCYLKAEDGETEIDNMWRIGDQALCQATNLRDYQSTGSFETRSYFRLVVGRGNETLADGNAYNYVDLSNLSSVDVTSESGTLYEKELGYDTSRTGEPQAGDSIVQFGYRFDDLKETEESFNNTRQYVYAIYVSEGRRVDYAGVNTFSINRYIVNDISPKKWEVSAGSFRFVSRETNVSKPATINRGEWVEGTAYAYWEQVSWNGSIWLCQLETGVTYDEPTESSADWLKQVEVGATGRGISSIEEYYLATTQESGVTTTTSGWTRDTQTITETKKYLWYYDITNYTDGTKDTSTPIIIGVYGTKGTDGTSVKILGAYDTEDDLRKNGDKSAVGNGYLVDGDLWVWNGTDWQNVGQIKGDNGTSVTITETETAYAVSTSGTTAPTSGWNTTIPTVAQGSYLWTKTTVLYSDGTSTEAYSVSRQGVNGTSITIKSKSVTYAVAAASTNGVQPADSAFTYTSVPSSIAQGSYLWSKTTIVYSDNNTTNAYAVARMGADGNNGVTIHLAYSTSADGSENFSTTAFEGATYLGIWENAATEDSENYKDYTWSLIKGDKGDDAEFYDLLEGSGNKAETDANGTLNVNFSFYIQKHVGDTITKLTGTSHGYSVRTYFNTTPSSYLGMTNSGTLWYYTISLEHFFNLSTIPSLFVVELVKNNVVLDTINIPIVFGASATWEINTELGVISGQVSDNTNHISNYEQKADKIQLSVEQIYEGAENLLYDTEFADKLPVSGIRTITGATAKYVGESTSDSHNGRNGVTMKGACTLTWLYVPVIAGAQYMLSAWYKVADQEDFYTRQYSYYLIGITYYDADKTQLSRVPYRMFNSSDAIFTWNRWSQELSVPSGASYCSILFYSATGATYGVNFSEFMLTRGTALYPWGKGVHDTAQLILTQDSITERVSNAEGEIGTLQTTASEISATVERNATGADNLLFDAGFLQPIDYPNGNREGRGTIVSKAHNGRNGVTLTGDCNITWTALDLEWGEDYTVSVRVKGSNLTLNSGNFWIYFHVYDTSTNIISYQSYDITEYISKTSPDYERIAITFSVPTKTSTSSYCELVICGDGADEEITIAEPMLTIGDELYPWSTGSTDMAQLIVTADNISAEVKGEYSKAGLSITQNGIQFTGNLFEFCSPNGTPYIKVSQDDAGIPHFRFLDTDGKTEVYDLGYTGLTKLIGDTVAYKYASSTMNSVTISSSGTITINPTSIYNGTYPARATYYLFTAKKSFANDKAVYASSAAGSYDGRYFTKNDLTNANANPTTYNPTSTNTLVDSIVVISGRMIYSDNERTKIFQVTRFYNGILKEVSSLSITKESGDGRYTATLGTESYTISANKTVTFTAPGVVVDPD